MSKTVYAFDASGVFAGLVLLTDADLSPLEDGVYLVPAGCTEVAPPEVDEQHRAVWSGEAWTIEALPTDPEPEPPNAEQLRASLLAGLTAQYEQRTAAIGGPYPPSERESWPVQTGEARALLADDTAETPWIDAAAAARGLDRVELDARIVALDNAYRVLHGSLSGTRQRIEGEIYAAGDDVAALQAIDVAAGWPA